MPQISVSVGARSYRITCGEGEEEHLRRLAEMLDERIRGMRTQFGEIGDQRMTIMAALTLADELSDAKSRLGGAEAELTALQSERRAEQRQQERLDHLVAAALDEVAAALDDATGRLTPDRGA